MKSHVTKLFALTTLTFGLLVTGLAQQAQPAPAQQAAAPALTRISHQRSA